MQDRGDRAFLHEYTLRWRHFKMGYGRSTTVDAITAESAIEAGREKLEDGNAFDLISLQRGKIVGRAS